MKKFGVVSTIIYNGYSVVEADNEEEAIEKVKDMLDRGGENAPCSIDFGEVNFGFGEVTTDYADEIDGDGDDYII